MLNNCYFINNFLTFWCMLKISSCPFDTLWCEICKLHTDILHILSNINTQQSCTSYTQANLQTNFTDRFWGGLVSVSLSSAFIIYIMLNHVGKYQCTYLGAYVYGLIYEWMDVWLFFFSFFHTFPKLLVFVGVEVLVSFFSFGGLFGSWLFVRLVIVAVKATFHL